jgi:tetratricopeptide (TPR) repeat protein
VGVGPGAFAISFAEFRPADYASQRVGIATLHAHNEYLQVMAEAGMLGAVSFAIIIGLVLVGSGRVLTGPGGKDRMLLNASLAAAVTMLVHASASVDVRYPTCRLILWVLLGLAAARWRDASADDEPAARPAAFAWRWAAVFAGAVAALAIWNTQVYGPHQARVYLHTAEKSQEAGQWADSVEAASRAIKFDPASFPSYHVLANSLFYAGEYEAALAAFDRVQTHSPGYADGHVRIGVVNALLGRMDAARDALRLARRYNAVSGELARADELSDDELRKLALAFENKERGRPRRTTPPARSLPNAPACGSRDTSPPAR